MKTKHFFSLFWLVFSLLITSCDNNDDTQSDPSNPTDGYSLNGNFYETPNAYITIDQTDANNDNFPDYYGFYFLDGRMTDHYGDLGIGNAYAFSTNTTRLARFRLDNSQNPSLNSGTLTAGQTYISLTGANRSTVVGYNLQTATSIFGTINGVDYAMLDTTLGNWHYCDPDLLVPSVTINAINIDSNTPANSTIDVDYTFKDLQGNPVVGHYEGKLGVILD